MTELEQASRYAKLLVASLEEASDVEEALMAADLAMEFKESEHPRNKDGEFAKKVDEEDFFAVKPGALFATATEKGCWITIGGQKGKDGKRKGGSPVYIVNGRITKGAPSLTGKTIKALKEEGDDDTKPKEKIDKEISYGKNTSEATRDAVRSALNAFREMGAKLPRLTIVSDNHELETPAESRHILLQFNPALIKEAQANDAEARKKFGIAYLVDPSLEGIARHEAVHSLVKQADEKDRDAWLDEARKMMPGSEKWLSMRGEANADEFISELGSAYLGRKNLPEKAEIFARKVLGISDDPATHRQQMNREKNYQRAVWGKKARKEGLYSKHLHQLAAEVMAHDKEFNADVTNMLQHARETSRKQFIHGKRAGFDLRTAIQNAAKTGSDYTDIPGFDTTAENAAREYPHLFHGKEAPEERLWNLLMVGNPESMTEDEAYSQAFDYLMENRKDKDDEDEVPFSLEAYFAFDIFNRQAQGILNRSLKAAKGLSRQAKESLIAALKLPSPTEVAHAVVQFVEKYRIQLAKLLTTTQLAAVLEGAKEVAKKLPVIPPDGLGAPLPASISPAETTELVERVRQMPEEERWRTVYSLPADQQRFVLAQMRISGGIAPPPTLQAPADEDEGIHFPIIDEAVRELSSKNVIDRYSFDRLDAAARQKAFTVARVDADETLIRIRDALAENVRTGADYETFKEAVLQDVEAGTFLSDGHMENVFRTNVQTAFSDGQMNVLSMPFVKSGFPYVAYEAIHDDRVEADHLAMESHGIAGTNIFRIDDPVFQLFRPPWRWMCRCSYIPYTVQMAARAGIEEARTWLETGIEPTPPAYVQMPPFQPPPGFRRSLNAAPLSIQLSLQLPSTWHDRLKGGLADKKTPVDFDKESLLEGMRVELEHTDDPLIALEIAMDHLTEDSEYYRKLKKVEE